MNLWACSLVANGPAIAGRSCYAPNHPPQVRGGGLHTGATESNGGFTVERIVETAELYFGSGTDFETPFNIAVDILRAEYKAKGFVSGDVVMLTDGVCGVSDDWKGWFAEERRRLGFTTYGVLIGRKRWTEPLSALCDGRVCAVSDLLTGGDIRDVFRGV